MLACPHMCFAHPAASALLPPQYNITPLLRSVRIKIPTYCSLQVLQDLPFAYLSNCTGNHSPLHSLLFLEQGSTFLPPDIHLYPACCLECSFFSFSKFLFVCMCVSVRVHLWLATSHPTVHSWNVTLSDLVKVDLFNVNPIPCYE